MLKLTPVLFISMDAVKALFVCQNNGTHSLISKHWPSEAQSYPMSHDQGLIFSSGGCLEAKRDQNSSMCVIALHATAMLCLRFPITQARASLAFMVVVCSCDFSNPRAAVEAAAIFLRFETWSHGFFAIDATAETSPCPKRAFPLLDRHECAPCRLCGGTWSLRVIISSPLQWIDKLSKTSKYHHFSFFAVHCSVFPFIPDKNGKLSTSSDTFRISACSHDGSGQCPSARKFRGCSEAYHRGGAWKKISESSCFNRLPSR